MKISIHTDALIGLAKSLDRNADKPVPLFKLLDRGHCECWAPALCIAKAHEAVCQQDGETAGRRFLEFVQKRISSAPLRNVTLTDSLQYNISSLEAASHLAVDSLVGIDAILSSSLEPSEVNGLKCVHPDQFDAEDTVPRRNGKVPFVDLKAQFPDVYNEIDDRITDIMSTTGFILGHHVEEFETRFAELQKSKHCIGVSSGTDALHIAFLALGIGPGDEVIIPVNTFIATAEGVSLTGATPVFVDSNEYYNIDIESARNVLEKRGSSGRRRAIVPVHLYGQPADLDAVASLADDFGISIVEDCAQAHLAEYRGNPVGNSGKFGAFSYYPGKNLGAYGEAGALVTNDDNLAERAKMMRAHGEATRYMHSIVGHNYRMEAMQGAVLATKVKYLANWTEARQRNALLYTELLADVGEIQLPKEPDFAKSVYHLYVIQTDNRDELRNYLDQHGIASGLHYPVPLHLQAAYSDLGYRQGDFPVAEKQASRIVSLPMYPELAEHQIEQVCNTIKLYFGRA